MGENERITAEQKLLGVLGELERRKDEIAHVLPNDISADAFFAIVNQALRNNPKLLRCTGPSLVNACIKAAYDGLRIDGKEAAIVDAEERYNDNGTWKTRIVARYMPMVFGLIKQILKGGGVIAMHARIVYENEVKQGRFDLVEGSNPHIVHKPMIEGDRGRMMGAYSIATLASGVTVHEWMRADEILDVRKESKFDGVWDRWPTEMWKKTVIRRHRKTLPGTSAIRDMEAREMFPQFDRAEPHPQLAAPIPARPRRDQGALPAPEQELETDFAPRDRGEPVEREERRDDQQRQAARADGDDGELPADEGGWATWGVALEEEIGRSVKVDDVNKVWRRENSRLQHAPRAMRERLTSQFTDRIATLASETGAGAEAGGQEDNASAGEQ
ncbi:MAG TPA: recombinase RecT [Allosphingosinicella sp.]|jgi:recombination protein RecT